MLWKEVLIISDLFLDILLHDDHGLYMYSRPKKKSVRTTLQLLSSYSVVPSKYYAYV